MSIILLLFAINFLVVSLVFVYKTLLLETIYMRSLYTAILLYLHVIKPFSFTQERDMSSIKDNVPIPA